MPFLFIELRKLSSAEIGRDRSRKARFIKNILIFRMLRKGVRAVPFLLQRLHDDIECACLRLWSIVAYSSASTWEANFCFMKETRVSRSVIFYPLQYDSYHMIGKYHHSTTRIHAHELYLISKRKIYVMKVHTHAQQA